jgi:hypothetical protein
MSWPRGVVMMQTGRSIHHAHQASSACIDSAITTKFGISEVLRERIAAGNLGLRDPRSIVQGRNVLFGMFGGKVPLRPSHAKSGERPFLVARVGLNRGVLLEAAASAAGCVKSGSGGPLRAL